MQTLRAQLFTVLDTRLPADFLLSHLPAFAPHSRKTTDQGFANPSQDDERHDLRTHDRPARRSSHSPPAAIFARRARQRQPTGAKQARYRAMLWLPHGAGMIQTCPRRVCSRMRLNMAAVASDRSPACRC